MRHQLVFLAIGRWSGGSTLRRTSVLTRLSCGATRHWCFVFEAGRLALAFTQYRIDRLHALAREACNRCLFYRGCPFPRGAPKASCGKSYGSAGVGVLMCIKGVAADLQLTALEGLAVRWIKAERVSLWSRTASPPCCRPRSQSFPSSKSHTISEGPSWPRSARRWRFRTTLQAAALPGVGESGQRV